MSFGEHVYERLSCTNLKRSENIRNSKVSTRRMLQLVKLLLIWLTNSDALRGNESGLSGIIAAVIYDFCFDYPTRRRQTWFIVLQQEWSFVLRKQSFCQPLFLMCQPLVETITSFARKFENLKI